MEEVPGIIIVRSEEQSDVPTHAQLCTSKDKQLRLYPRKKGNATKEEIKNCHSWIKSAQRIAPVTQVEPPQEAPSAMNFRRIRFNTIPESAKPEFEQKELVTACSTLMDMMDLRDKYIFYDDAWLLRHPLLNTENPVVADIETEDIDFKLIDGVVTLFYEGKPLDVGAVSLAEFYSDLYFVQSMSYNVIVKSFSFQRLKMLEMRFEMHETFNGERETYMQRVIAKRDFYNIIKVDNHVEISSCMTEKHLQTFLKKKMKREPDTVVQVNGIKSTTLSMLFESISITSESLTTDVINCLSDKFTLSCTSGCSPMGEPLLKKTFLDRGGVLRGRYFAEIVKQVTKNLANEEYSKSEISIRVVGKDPEEWSRIARWFATYSLKSYSVAWLVEIPRMYDECRQRGKVANFQELLSNIFEPLFRVTLDPSSDSNLAEMLNDIVGFNFSHDERQYTKSKTYPNVKAVNASEWETTDNPPFSYWAYHLYTNIYTLNRLRYSKGLNTFAFRPDTGEFPTEENLPIAFLLAHSINHGLLLSASPVLQHLFYLKQIGISMSPLSNNKRAEKFSRNPFYKFFKRGLNVALSTHQPLRVHMTKEPLLEEYSIAGQILNLTQTDLCEVARNSVLQSGFSQEQKIEWLGNEYIIGRPDTNDMNKTNIPNIRVMYRYETFNEEHAYIQKHASDN